MSLFSNLNTQRPASSGPSTGGGLFGAPASTTNASAPSLFSNLGAASSTAQSSTTQPTSSLFGGNLGAAKSTATATPSLFASAAPAAQPQTQTQTSSFSLFSKPATTTVTANPLSSTQQTAPLGQTSLFGATSTQQPQQQQQQQQQQQGGFASQSTANTSRSAHFDHLLERGRKRNASQHGPLHFDELPSLQLGLGDIARKVRNLGAGGPSADQAYDGAQDRAA